MKSHNIQCNLEIDNWRALSDLRTYMTLEPCARATRVLNGAAPLPPRRLPSSVLASPAAKISPRPANLGAQEHRGPRAQSRWLTAKEADDQRQGCHDGLG
jgi:hypothetical protein